MNLNEHLRRSGRTHKMLLLAAKMSQDGRQVNILFATDQMATTMERTRFADFRRHVPTGMVVFRKVPPNFNWETMRPAGESYDFNTVYLVDHSLAEQEVLRLQHKIAHFELLKMQIYQMTL